MTARAALLVAAALALAPGACARFDYTMAEEQCRRADWRQVGRRDGEMGRTQSFFSRHVSACAKADVTPDQAEWRLGRLEGLAALCADGASGALASPVCQGAGPQALLEAEFASREAARERERALFGEAAAPRP